MRQKRIRPALVNSPLSTLGTTRMTANSKECGVSIESLLHKEWRPGQAALEVGEVGLTRGAGQPFVWYVGQDSCEDGFGQAGAQEFVGLGDLGGPAEQDMVADGREGAQGFAFDVIDTCVTPTVMEIEAGTVVYEVELLVPPEQIGVAGGAVDIGHQGVEPDGGGGYGWVHGTGRQPGCGVEHDGAGKVVHGEVQAVALQEKFADFGIGFIAAEGAVEFHEREVRNAQAEGAADFTGDQFGYEGERPLAGTAEFQHVEAAVVSFHDGGQGAAFAEGCDVASGADSSQLKL